MVILHIRAPNGDTYDVSVSDLQVDLHIVEDLINERYFKDKPRLITFVCRGNTLNKDMSLEDQHISTESVIIIVTKPVPQAAQTTQPQTTQPTQPQATQATQAAQTTPATTTAQPTQTTQIQSPYVRSYSGAEIIRAIKADYTIIYNVMNLIAQSNPFFLSYLAVNPDMAKEHVDKTLSDPAFSMTVIGANETEDIIKALLMNPQGENPYQVDSNNIEYILSVTDLTDRDRVKSMYLMMDRDIARTIKALSPGTLTVNNVS